MVDTVVYFRPTVDGNWSLTATHCYSALSNSVDAALAHTGMLPYLFLCHVYVCKLCQLLNVWWRHFTGLLCAMNNPAPAAIPVSECCLWVAVCDKYSSWGVDT